MLSKYTTDERSNPFQINCVEKNVINNNSGKPNSQEASNYKATFIV
jgi:hypothetical protein